MSRLESEIGDGKVKGAVAAPVGRNYRNRTSSSTPNARASADNVSAVPRLSLRSIIATMLCVNSAA